MKCIELQKGVDICVTVQVKLIDRGKRESSIQDELMRDEMQHKAAYLGGKEESDIAERIKIAMAAETA